jgi:putative protease
MRTPEILAPAGSEDALLAALRCGADAVYVGGKQFSARQNAANFDLPQLQRAAELCHLYGAKLYLTVNTLVFAPEFPALVQFLEAAIRLGVDAFLVQDFGLLELIRQISTHSRFHADDHSHAGGCPLGKGARHFQSRGFPRALPQRNCRDL